MIKIDLTLQPSDLAGKLKRFWQLSAEKIRLIENSYDASKGSPVFTCKGEYMTRGWTEWTQGFQYGSMILQYDATGEKEFLEMGRRKAVESMAPHISHMGVHDHGFNNVSTYGNLLRLMKEGKIVFNEWESHFYSLALKISEPSRPGGGRQLKAEVLFIHSTGPTHFLLTRSVPAVLWFSAIASDTSCRKKEISGSVYWNVRLNISKRLQRILYFMVKVVIPTMFGDEQHTRVSSMSLTEIFVARIHSRDTRVLPHGQEGWHGPYVDSPKKLNGSIL